MVTKHLPGAMALPEKISQWMDGEIDEEVECSVYAELKDADARATWALYHHIGDVLRGTAQHSALSAGFTARVAQALAVEPPVLLPSPAAASLQTAPAAVKPSYRIWALAATMGSAVVIGGMVFALLSHPVTPAEVMPRSELAAESSPPTPAIEDGLTLTCCGHDLTVPIPTDYLSTYLELSASASIWPGINVYQWLDSTCGYNFIGEP